MSGLRGVPGPSVRAPVEAARPYAEGRASSGPTLTLDTTPWLLESNSYSQRHYDSVLLMVTVVKPNAALFCKL